MPCGTVPPGIRSEDAACPGAESQLSVGSLQNLTSVWGESSVSVGLGAGSLQLSAELGAGWVAAQPRGAGALRGRVRRGRLVMSQGTAQEPRHFVLLLPRVDTARGCGPLISFISSASVSFVKPLGDGKSSTPLVTSCKAGCTHTGAHFLGGKGLGEEKCPWPQYHVANRCVRG